MVDVVVLLQRTLLHYKQRRPMNCSYILDIKHDFYHAPYDSRRAALEVVAHEWLLLVSGAKVLDWRIGL